MSWVDKIKEGITIVTGDGVTHAPLYVITTKEITYNVAEFEFVNVEGTLVKRSKPKGTRHNLEIIFQGEDHLDTALAFEISSKDPRAWEIIHPLYGKLIAQPLSLIFDPSGLNTTKITGQLIETILEDFPKTSVDPRDSISQNVEIYKELTVESFVDNVEVNSGDINAIRDQTIDVYALGSETVKTGEQSNEYFELFNQANAAILNGYEDTSKMIASVVDLFIFPSLFLDGVKDRYRMFENQLIVLNNTIAFLNTKSLKLIYEVNAGAIITAQVNAAVNEINGDYNNSDSVFFIIDKLTSSFNTYITNLNNLQSLNGAVVGGYIPSYTSLTSLSSLVSFTVSNLLDIALDSKTKRTFILDKDTNPLLLAHRFYGLDDEDINYELFLEQNGVVLTDLLIMKKGTAVIYFI